MNKSIVPLLFVMTIIASCNVQSQTTESNRKAEAEWVDPLFFIEGQLCRWIRHIFQDSQGHLWFGTNHYGVMRYDGDTLVYFNSAHGLGGGRINGIVEDKEGNVWFSTFEGLTKYDGQSFVNFQAKLGTINNDLWGMTIDRQGIFWVGTLEGVVRFDPFFETFTFFDVPKPEITNTTSVLSKDRVICILEDQNGTLWFGTDGFGLCQYNPVTNTFTHLTTKEGLPDNVIRSILEDSMGNLWIGTMYGGVSRYDGRSFANFTADGAILGSEVGGLFEDSLGNIWFAAENFGIYRYDGKSFQHFGSLNGFADGLISILEDREGRFWFGGWGGLFRFGEEGLVSVNDHGPWK